MEIALRIQNTTSETVRAELLGGFNKNQNYVYRWEVDESDVLANDYVQLRSKLIGESIFTLYEDAYIPQTVAKLIQILNSFGIGTFSNFYMNGRLILQVSSTTRVFSLLDISHT